MAIVEDAGGQSQRHHGAVGVVDSALHMAQQFDLEHEVLTSPAFQARYPRLQAGPQARIYIEPGAFTLHAERCHEALLDRGMAAGAELRYEQAVTALRDKASHVRLLLASGEEVAARRAIVCAGPWTSNLVPADTLSVLPQPVAWFRDDEPTEAFIPFVRVRADAPLIFGFPGFEEGSDVKIVLENERTAVTSPGAAARLLMHELQRDLVKAAHEVLGSLGESATHRQTCYYTSTPDGQLRVGDVTRSIGMVSACSGHGFKYAPAIAQRIASRLVAKQSLDRVLTEC
jgi:sarcosine oxidase